MNYKELMYDVKGACIKVHEVLGAGLLESVYEAVLAAELMKRGHAVLRQQQVPVIYEGVKLEQGFRADIIVDNALIIEIKSVDKIAPVHHLQLNTYMKLTGCPMGLLLNFNTTKLIDSMYTVWPSTPQ